MTIVKNHNEYEKTKFRHGDVFVVPLPDGTYLPGRIRLDFHGSLKKQMFPAGGWGRTK